MSMRLSEAPQVFWRQPQVANGFLQSFDVDQRPRVRKLVGDQLVDQLVHQFFLGDHNLETSPLALAGSRVRVGLPSRWVIGYARLAPTRGIRSEVYKKNSSAVNLGVNVPYSIAKIPVGRHFGNGEDELVGNILVHELVEGVKPLKDLVFENLPAYASFYYKVMETLAINLNRGVVFRDLTLEDIFFGEMGIFFPRMREKDFLLRDNAPDNLKKGAAKIAVRSAAALSGEFAAQFYTQFGMEGFHQINQIIREGATSFRLRLDPRWGYANLTDSNRDRVARAGFGTDFILRFAEVFEWLQRVGKVRVISPN